MKKELKRYLRKKSIKDINIGIKQNNLLNYKYIYAIQTNKRKLYSCYVKVTTLRLTMQWGIIYKKEKNQNN